MRTATAEIGPLNKYAKAYVHLYRMEIHIYQPSTTTRPLVVSIPASSPAQGLDLHGRAEALLNSMGWTLGVDHWREPLDPTKPLLATAQLLPL